MSRTARMTEREANILARRVLLHINQWDEVCFLVSEENSEYQADIVEILLGEIEDA